MTHIVHAELMELSKDIGKVGSRVSALETGVAALGTKQSEDMEHVRADMQRGFSRIDAQHLELMAELKKRNDISESNNRRLNTIEPTVEFVQRWRERWLAVVLTIVVAGTILTWLFSKAQLLKLL